MLSFRKLPKYKIHPLDGTSLFPVIEIKSGKFKGTKFTCSPRLRIEEEDSESLRLRLEYFILSGIEKSPELDKLVGEIALEIFQQEA